MGHDDSNRQDSNRADASPVDGIGTTTATPAPAEPSAPGAWRSYPDGLIARTPGRRTLWVTGDLARLRGVRLAVIGSRRPTAEQAALTTVLCAAASTAGAVVCSGGALGVDGLAHRAALGVQGATALVSPVAPGSVYPRGHGALFAAVAAQGVVLTPFAPETPFRRAHFRTRNGVLARLVDALVVICADPRSGSLHCARQAWKLGLPVFAVPWSPGSPHAEGTNMLLNAGARAISHPAEVAELVARLRAGEGRRCLAREAAPPSQVATVRGSTRQPLQGQIRGPTQGPIDGDLPISIDAARGRWQRYAPPAQAPVGQIDPAFGGQGGDFSALDGHGVAATVRRTLQQRSEGVSLEQLVVHTGSPRGDLAKLLLNWTLTGVVRRDRWGRYHVG